MSWDATQAEPSFEREKPISVFARAKRLSFFLTVSLAINLALALGAFGAAAFLFFKFIKPPFGVISPPLIVTQDHGYVTAHDVELFHQREDFVESFLRMVMDGLLNGEPLAYNNSFLQPYVSPAVMRKYSDLMEEKGAYQSRFNRRYLWNMQETRRYYEKGFSKYMIVAIKGDNIVYQDVEEEKTREVEVRIKPTLFIVHLLATPYSRANPWGLYVAAIREDDVPSRMHKIWELTKDLTKTIDLRGQSILSAPQKQEP